MQARVVISKRLAAVFLVLAVVVVAVLGRNYWIPFLRPIMGKRTVKDVITQVGPAALARIKPAFAKANVPYPQKRIALVAFKDVRQLHLFADRDGDWVFIHTYDIRAASGGPGPKLREGDKQVPEGVYGIEGLNPNSAYHLSMKVNYPNVFDSAMAEKDNRTGLGGDIFIHGKAASIGCLAMGDEAIEELFTLTHDVGTANVMVIIAPCDLRTISPPEIPDAPAWAPVLYNELRIALASFTGPK